MYTLPGMAHAHSPMFPLDLSRFMDDTEYQSSRTCIHICLHLNVCSICLHLIHNTVHEKLAFAWEEYRSGASKVNTQVQKQNRWRARNVESLVRARDTGTNNGLETLSQLFAFSFANHQLFWKADQSRQQRNAFAPYATSSSWCVPHAVASVPLC